LILYGLGDTLFPLLVSFMAAYLSFPLVKKLEARNIGRRQAVLALFSALLIGFVLVLVLIVPGLIREVREFVTELPQSTARAIETVENLALRLGFELNLSNQGIRDLISNHIAGISGALVENVTKGIGMAFSGVTGWLLAILNLFLLPLFFFYVINDYEKISKEIKSFTPKSARPKLLHYVSLGNRVLNGYIRGQIIVALVLGLLYGTGLSILGLKFGFLIGLLSGFLNLIPYAGFVIGLTTALVIGFANFSGMNFIFGIILVYAIIQALESFVITPKIVGDKVGLSAFATMLALIIGGNLMGLTGMLIAIPTAAILKSVLAELKKEYQLLGLYQD
jgi:predicted PurR-regulated permease PerM